MNLLTLTTDVVVKILYRIFDVITSFSGWLLGSLIFLVTEYANFLGDTRIGILSLVLVATIIDLLWAVGVSIKRGMFCVSTGLTKTFLKLGVYATFLTMAVILESALTPDWDYLFRGMAAIIITAEIISISAHILIIKPNLPFLRLMTKFLSSEISKKLGVSEEDVKELMKKHESD